MHYLFIATLISAIALIFLAPPIGVIATIGMVCVNIVQYYKMKGQVESFFYSCGYLTSIIAYAKDIYELDNVLAKAVTSLCPNSEHISLKASS